MMVKHATNEVHIPKTFLRWLRILTFTRRGLEHPSIEHGSLPEVAHILLMIYLPVMIRLAMIAFVRMRICIHTVEIILSVS